MARSKRPAAKRSLKKSAKHSPKKAVKRRVKPIPDGYHSIAPYLSVSNAQAFIEFVQRAFGAKEVLRHQAPNGSIAHAEVRIGDSIVMMGEPPGGGTPCGLFLYVRDVDAAFERARQAGAAVVAPPEDKFYGERMAGITDPAGNTWWIATHIENVSPREAARRAAAMQRG